MRSSITGLLAWLGMDHRGRVARYTVASVVSVLVGQAVLAITFALLAWNGAAANITAFFTAAAASYWLNRTWTWGKRGRSRLLREVMPFYALTAASLLLSTLAVVAAETATGADTRAIQTAAVMVASLTVHGALWIIKYAILHRYLFGQTTPTPSATTQPSRTDMS